jgi:GntR family transcriptional regulator
VTIERDSAVPPYRQLAGILRDQIASGELAPGAPLPSVKRLRQEYGVAETTARKAVALLRGEGLVETVMGWGSFVAKG